MQRVHVLNQMSFAAALAQPHGLYVDDQPDDTLLPSGGGVTTIEPAQQIAVTPAVQPHINASGIFMPTRRPAPTPGNTSESIVAQLPRLKPPYTAADVTEKDILQAAKIYSGIRRKIGNNPIEECAIYLRKSSAVEFAAWWNMMGKVEEKEGGSETDGVTNSTLTWRTGILIYLAKNSGKLADTIPPLMDFFAQEYHKLVLTYPITDGDQRVRLFTLLWDLGKSTHYPVFGYHELFSALFEHAIIIAKTEESAAEVVGAALLEIVQTRPDVPVLERHYAMQRYTAAGFGEIDLINFTE